MSTASSGRRRAPPPAPSTSTSSLQGGSGSSFDQLKTKFLNVDRNYETLKQLTRKGTNLRLDRSIAVHAWKHTYVNLSTYFFFSFVGIWRAQEEICTGVSASKWSVFSVWSIYSRKDDSSVSYVCLRSLPLEIIITACTVTRSFLTVQLQPTKMGINHYNSVYSTDEWCVVLK